MSANSLVLLLQDGSVWSTGSALQSTLLGRMPSSSHPASRPHMIPFLGGIPIKKVVAGGWLCAALSVDRDLYIWGGRPGDQGQIEALSTGDDDMVRLVDIHGQDILDVGVGSGHILVLTTQHELWTCGDNQYGQLGLDSHEDFFARWTKVPWQGQKIRGIYAGGWNSWLSA